MGHRNIRHESDISYLRSCPWHSNFKFSGLRKTSCEFTSVFKIWMCADVTQIHHSQVYPHLHFYSLKEIQLHPYISIYPSFQHLFLLCCPGFEFSSFLQILFNTHNTCISKIKSASSFSYHWPCSCYMCQNIQVHSSHNSPSPNCSRFCFV